MDSMRKAWRRASTKFEHLVAPPAAIVLREALKTGDERRALKIYHARDKRGRTLCEEMHPSMPFSSDGSDSDRADTPLHLSASCGACDILLLFLQRGGNPNVTNGQQRTALHLACGGAPRGALRVKRGARSSGMTSEEHEARRTRCLELLLEWRGHEIDSVQERPLINATDADGCSALHYAALAGRAQLCAMLVSRGAIISLVDNRQRTPCDLAAAQHDAHFKELALQLEALIVWGDTSGAGATEGPGALANVGMNATTAAAAAAAAAAGADDSGAWATAAAATSGDGSVGRQPHATQTFERFARFDTVDNKQLAAQRAHRCRAVVLQLDLPQRDDAGLAYAAALLASHGWNPHAVRRRQHALLAAGNDPEELWNEAGLKSPGAVAAAVAASRPQRSEGRVSSGAPPAAPPRAGEALKAATTVDCPSMYASTVAALGFALQLPAVPSNAATLRATAAPHAAPTPAPELELEPSCGICCSNFGDDGCERLDARAMGMLCDHSYCKACWRQYVCTSLEGAGAGASRALRCPGHGECSALLSTRLLQWALADAAEPAREEAAPTDPAGTSSISGLRRLRFLHDTRCVEAFSIACDAFDVRPCPVAGCGCTVRRRVCARVGPPAMPIDPPSAGLPSDDVSEITADSSETLPESPMTILECGTEDEEDGDAETYAAQVAVMRSNGTDMTTGDDHTDAMASLCWRQRKQMLRRRRAGLMDEGDVFDPRPDSAFELLGGDPAADAAEAAVAADAQLPPALVAAGPFAAQAAAVTDATCAAGHTFCWYCGEDGGHAPCSCGAWRLWRTIVARETARAREARAAEGSEVGGAQSSRLGGSAATASSAAANAAGEDEERAAKSQAVEANELAHSMWLVANTKQCPRCRSNIEKNEGCNHMTCQKCAHEFCWICMGDWKLHSRATGGFYRCNRFDDSASATVPRDKRSGDRGDPSQRNEGRGSAAESARQQAQAARKTALFLHYFTRFEGHTASRRFEQSLLADADARLCTLRTAWQRACAGQLWGVTESATKNAEQATVQVREALTELVACRSALRASYAVGLLLAMAAQPRNIHDIVSQSTVHQLARAERRLRQEVTTHQQRRLHEEQIDEAPDAGIDAFSVDNDDDAVEQLAQLVLRLHAKREALAAAQRGPLPSTQADGAQPPQNGGEGGSAQRDDSDVTAARDVLFAMGSGPQAWPPCALPRGCRSRLRAVQHAFEAAQGEIEMLTEQLSGMVARQRLRASAQEVKTMLTTVRAERKQFCADVATRWNVLAIVREALRNVSLASQSSRRRGSSRRQRPSGTHHWDSDDLRAARVSVRERGRPGRSEPRHRQRHRFEREDDDLQRAILASMASVSTNQRIAAAAPVAATADDADPSPALAAAAANGSQHGRDGAPSLLADGVTPAPAATVAPTPPPSGRDDAGRTDQGPMQWSCGACTMLNDAFAEVCTMCGTPRPQPEPTTPFPPVVEDGDAAAPVHFALGATAAAPASAGPATTAATSQSASITAADLSACLGRLDMTPGHSMGSPVADTAPSLPPALPAASVGAPVLAPAPAPASTPASVSASAGPWTCSVCTLINNASDERCIACRQPRS